MNFKNLSGPFLAAFVILFILLRGISYLFANFDWTSIMLMTCMLVVAGASLSWSLIHKVFPGRSLREVGFGIPDWSTVIIATVLGALMVVFIPIYAVATRANIHLQAKWLWLALGIFAGAGVAEETLFRGFVFNFLRRGRSFWQAASLSMLFFGAMHLLLLLWLPIPVAIAAILLSIISAYPTAYLFEKSNNTIWPSAILHSAALATNLFAIPKEITVTFSLVWIGVVLVFLILVFLAGWLFLRPGFEGNIRTSSI
jgi:membrane protease YdiL (CAAX protease family)